MWIGATTTKIEPITVLNAGSGAAATVGLPETTYATTWDGHHSFRLQGDRVFAMAAVNPFMEDGIEGQLTLKTPNSTIERVLTPGVGGNITHVGAPGDHELAFAVTYRGPTIPFAGAVVGLDPIDQRGLELLLG